MYELPTSICINEKQFNITNKGDYRMVLDCFNAINDPELSEREQIITALIIFYEDIESLEHLFAVFNTDELLTQAISEMFLFFNCGEDHVGAETNYKLTDWNKDANIIIAAVNKVANKELRAEEYVHWWTFMSYYISIGNSVFSTVVSIRQKIVKHKKLEKEEKEFRKDNPHYFDWDFMDTNKMKADEAVKNLWNQS